MIWFFLAMVKVCELLEDGLGACLKGFASCQCALASILSQNIVRIARNSFFFGHADGGRCWGGRRTVAGAGGVVLTVAHAVLLLTRAVEVRAKEHKLRDCPGQPSAPLKFRVLAGVESSCRSECIACGRRRRVYPLR